MRPLIETNPYLRDPKKRMEMLIEDAYQSSIFEGAEGLVRPDVLPDSQPAPRRSIASRKKAVSAA
jgi:hypothetical protein